MNQSLLQLIQGRVDLYPHELEKRYARILNKVIELWGTPQLDAYFTELMIDTRGGTRQGFPMEVAAEIYRLSQIHEHLRQPGRAEPADPWAHINIDKQQEIEKLGYRCTPQDLLKSVENKDDDALSLFLSIGIPVDSCDERGWTPLMMASFNGSQAMAELLIRSGANVHARDYAGYGPMHWAAFNGYRNVVKLLLSKHAEVNARSQHGWTPLLQAATRGHLDACIVLIAGGAQVNMSSNDGWTPLHKACANGHTDIVRLLLMRGADRYAHYRDEVTPLALATKNRHEEIVALLLG